jgi:hypothetical protein
MHEDGKSGTEALRKATALAFSIRQTQETVAANVLNRAFDATYTFGDGLELCSTAHINQKGGTWRNELATAADISEASLEQSCIDIADFKTDSDRKSSSSRKSWCSRQVVFSTVSYAPLRRTTTSTP